jgi:protein gp37
MADSTLIARTDHPLNMVWGCTKISPGCTKCYADGLADRYGIDVWGPTKPRRTFGEKHWATPLKWNRTSSPEGPAKVICGSMCHWAEDYSTTNAERPKLWELILRCDRLIFQLLTKRADHVGDLLPDFWDEIKART